MLGPLESLEPRTHFSTTLDHGVLTVTGTNNADAITIAAGKRTFVVSVRGVETSFATDRVKLVRDGASRTLFRATRAGRQLVQAEWRSMDLQWTDD